MVSGKLQHTFFAPRIAILFASPGVISDSWIIAGIWQCFAARTTGTDTNPPLEKTTSGLSLRRMEIACPYPFNTLKGSEKFFQSK